ncbi:hypothetical protein SAMN02982917_3068 [Azospirillum oryzae]|uniref:Uncharacterized protein n=1 Tax=Azospirillum oryzae TaxID=286727 RepID=A0A1X7FMY2_9PROT|nr:hypothetical protein [Azospirillum oryzae]SMF55359.1 hypothetical protein SAMN02982917_3068 [Azospirillum oryzae]
MSVVVKGELILQDRETGEQLTIKASELDFQSDVIDEDREMGAEIFHVAEVEVEIWGEIRTVRIEVSEYPEGCLNYEDLDSGGLDVVQSFTVDIVLDDER